MDKKIPSVFVNKINRKISNYQTFYYSKNDQKDQSDISTSKIDDKIINKKINYFINLPKQFQTFNLIIKTADKNYETKLIGKVDNKVITLDNDIISIKDIISIDIKK